jgi:glycosyltransferase involved in cell wall biosynthesis
VVEKFYIIAPCFNEEKNIDEFTNNTLSTLKKYENFEIILVDDGSSDNTWGKIKNQCAKNNKILGIKLSKNFGKDSAIEAGLSKITKISNFDFVIIIDADLQHPIDKIPEMIDKWKNNIKIVTTFKKNNVESFIRKAGSDLFYFVMTNFSDAKFITKNTDFMLIDKKVVEIFNKLSEKNKSVKTFINWTGFETVSIPIKIEKRIFGKSKYNIFNLTRTAVNAITSFSFFPIKIVGYLGLLMSLISILLIPFFIISSWINFIEVSVQTLIIIFNIFLTGIILSSIGLLGIYISRIHQSSIDRPNFIIEDEILR